MAEGEKEAGGFSWEGKRNAFPRALKKSLEERS